MNLLWHEPGRMAYERFHAVYVQCFCGSIYIYIYMGAFHGIISYPLLLRGPRKARAPLYIYSTCRTRTRNSIFGGFCKMVDLSGWSSFFLHGVPPNQPAPFQRGPRVTHDRVKWNNWTTSCLHKASTFVFKRSRQVTVTWKMIQMAVT